MANIFPTLSTTSMQAFVRSPLSAGAFAMYPAGLSNSFVTRVIRFADDTEQAWVARGEMFSAMLRYHGVNGYDMSLVRDFFDQVKGGYVDDSLVNTFSITIDGVTYAHCTFEQDELVVQVSSGETYSFDLAIRQVAPNSATGV